ncbi:MAG: WD40 repeat domain-containing protein [bacterium]
MVISGDGRWLVTTEDRYQVVRRELPSGRKVWTHRQGSKAFCLAISGDGRTVASAGLDREVHLLDAATGRQRRKVRNKGAASGVALGPAGRWIALADQEQSGLLLMPLPSGKGRRLKAAGAAMAVAFSRGGHLAVGDEAGVVRLIAPSLRSVTATHRGFKPYITVVGFSPDGKQLAGAGIKGEIRVWKTSSGRLLRSVSLPAPWSVSFSHDGKLLASGGVQGLRIWELATGRVLFERKGGDYLLAAFSPKGRQLIVIGSRNQYSPRMRRTGRTRCQLAIWSY